MASITMKELLEAGVHFGHRTNRWNPKMKRYIYGGRNGIYIIDLHQTLKLFEDARSFIQQVAEENKPILFVGTKKQAQDAVIEAAKGCRQYWVNQRWLGGMLTNFKTIKDRIARLNTLTQMEADGTFEKLPKKEATMRREEMERLERNLGGIKDMPELPGAIFIVDLKKERIAVAEARKLEIPVVAIVDTNCDPDEVDWVIPGNDDAIRAIKLMCQKMSEAVIEIKQIEWQGAEVVDDDETTEEQDQIAYAASGEDKEVFGQVQTEAEQAAEANDTDVKPEVFAEAETSAEKAVEATEAEHDTPPTDEAPEDAPEPRLLDEEAAGEADPTEALEKD